jgi:hypothetical protein
MIQLTEIAETPSGGKYTVRSVYINPTQVVMVREDARMSGLMAEGKIDLGFTPNMRFSRVTVRGGTSNYDITVAGEPAMVFEKVNASRTLLKG